MCQRALTQKQTLWGGGALEVGDLRFVEDGSQRSGTLGSDVVASETASEGQNWNGECVGVSMGPDTKANTQDAVVRAPGGLLEKLQRRVALEALSESDSSFGTEVVPSQTASTGERRRVLRTVKGR